MILSTIAVTVTGTKEISKEFKGYDIIPSNASMMISISTVIGNAYGFASGNKTAFELPTTLPTLVFDRNHILQDFNLTNVKFSLYGKYSGTNIYEVSGINLTSMENGNSELTALGTLLPHSVSGNQQLFISDSVGNFVFLGNLAGVRDCLNSTQSTVLINSPPTMLNISSNLSMYDSLQSPGSLRQISINSTNSTTLVKLSFTSVLSLRLFETEFITFQLTDSSRSVSLSTKGLTATLTFDMDIDQFVKFVYTHKSALEGMGLS